MYARYIPPPKGGSNSNASPSQSSSKITNSPAPTPAANAFGVSRYVPPSAKPVAQSKQIQTPQVQYFDDAPPTNTKRKLDTSDESKGIPGPDSKKPKTEEPTAQKDGEDAPKKKKKVRRGKRRTGATNDDRDDDDIKPAQEAPEAKSKEADATPEESQTLDEDSAKDKKKPKREVKEKKQKRKRKSQNGEQESKVPHKPVPDEDRNEDVSMTDAAEPIENISEPTEPAADEEDKRRTRREKKKKEKETEPAEEQEDEPQTNQRHKTVMSKLEKSLKLASELPADEQDKEDRGELHGLEPLPQPEPVSSLTTSKPNYKILPSWLEDPIRVSQDTRTPFAELDIIPKACRVLEEKGFRDAFAVQTAAIPLLLPTSKQRGDVLISAATGSGKTLAYALPVVRDISQGCLTRLRALVVLPTRELVKQAQETFELCARAFDGGDRKRVRVGISIGSQSLEAEQKAFMDQELRYDPDTYKKLKEETQRRNQLKWGLSASENLQDLDMEDTDPQLSHMNGYVVDYLSKIDVLICTPGRLVEHMEQTRGFSLDYVRWLVVDEADKLLAQSFQGWLDLVMEQFRINKFTARDFHDMDFSGVRKVILSATLTRDLSLLSQLGLQRPRLIVLESDGDIQIAEHSLPLSLKEHAIRVHDTNLKPLYLLDLLRSQDMLMASPNKGEDEPKAEEAEDSDTSSDSSSSSGSDSDSDATSDTSSDTSSDSDSDTETNTKSKVSGRTLKSHIPISLIFTKSNESALRLSRLLALLDPSLADHIGTLTSTTPTHIRRKTLRAFSTASSPIRLLIASDLVARGIDLPNLDHVINYDLPPSVAGYVHRVGRTARAGKSGCAWTLVGDEESGWFWGKIAKGTGVKRAQKVERTRIEEIDEKRVEGYEAALEKLGKEAGR
ncbi:ATP-dependent RNA helicase dbp6 [Fusarium subglutinans]|uniref:ATP-dependent RNA helicase n=1 Tax=Gibberella subglutinans TaxID=42677 RepID=A0A8H5Q9F1_GIBSU|nr:ATP-dependent RNA helicase dbp6 [Fusarium subglutinans]KAF5610387.1 ATP-dependent RNA helicase dbp6 [Fusarium subglutinans]